MCPHDVIISACDASENHHRFCNLTLLLSEGRQKHFFVRTMKAELVYDQLSHIGTYYRAPRMVPILNGCTIIAQLAQR